jgi:hypothetical protein
MTFDYVLRMARRFFNCRYRSGSVIGSAIGPVIGSVICCLCVLTLPAFAKDGETPGRTVLHFPQEEPVGKLVLLKYAQSRQTFNETPYAMAQGNVTVDRDAIFLLEVNYKGASDLSFLKALPPGVIAGLRVKKVVLGEDKFLAMGGMKYLRIIDFSDVDISDRGFMHVKECTDLMELSITSSRITGKGLVVLKSMPHLLSLTLDQNVLGDDSMVYIGALKQLMWLRLKATSIGDAGMAHLKNLTELRKLIVCDNKRITDASLPIILSMQRLKRIDLSACKCTFAGLMQLKKMSCLVRLSIAYRDYTMGQIDQLKQAMPKCKVVDGLQSQVPIEVFSPLH